MIWIGLDPSIASFGWAVVSSEGVLNLGAWKTTVDDRAGKFADRGRRSLELGRGLMAVLREYQPQRAFIEAPAFLPRDGRLSVHASARVRGMAEGICLVHGVPVLELSPQDVKRSITGAPNASKEQVARRLQRLFPIPRVLDAGLDATDALAVAVAGDARRGAFAGATPNVVRAAPELDADTDVF